ncbi:ATP-binding protein [Nisaea sp.]|uniref:ATP-binding protein n=1 Tax=Nisaea sp. TaxID=2024842 RepID=UPI003264DD30
MINANNSNQLERLVREMCKLPAETEWTEFKENNDDPQMIGELIAALSNTAALCEVETAYCIWGIRNSDHNIVGTTFKPETAKKGNQDLESWLVQMMQPRLHFQFHRLQVDGQQIIVLEIPAARGRPTAFSGKEIVRIGSNKRSLQDVPEIERKLWRSFDNTPFEKQIALSDQNEKDVLRLLDYESYFQIQDIYLPSETDGVLECLINDRLIQKNDSGHYDITNLGATLLSRDLGSFPTVSRKRIRLVIYDGRGRIKTKREIEGTKGYATGFSGLMDYLKALLPRNEVIGDAIRREVPLYPDLALRELIANALIHQDFTISGAGPMVEVFDDRVEVTNPGIPLGDVERLLDQPPRSRNEALAAFMRRIGLCEERGSGVDKVVFETEFYQLPPPRWEISGESFRAILFSHKDLRDMDRDERNHACYLHASLKHVMREPVTNTSVRERFGIEEHNSAQASRIIRDALDAKLIKPYDLNQGKKNARYLPFWA